MSYIVHITDADMVKGVAKSSGNPFEMVRIQGILENGEERSIFRTILPRGSEVPARGRYQMEFEPVVNQQSLELGGAIISLKPFAPVTQTAKA